MSKRDYPHIDGRKDRWSPTQRFQRIGWPDQGHPDWKLVGRCPLCLQPQWSYVYRKRGPSADDPPGVITSHKNREARDHCHVLHKMTGGPRP